jgi:hypothetical protein
MDRPPLTPARLVLRVLLYGATLLSAYLLYDAIVSDDAPTAQWVGSIVVLVVMLPFMAMAWRLRLMSPEKREAHHAALAARHERLERESTLPIRKMAKGGDKRRILASGTDATARILAIRDGATGNTFSALVGLTLEVHPPRGQPYETQTGESVSRAAIGIVVPGHVLKIKVDPDDPNQVAVDWDASLRVD